MSKANYGGVGLELLLVAVTVYLLGSGSEVSPARAVAAGSSLMLALAVPSLAVLVWARKQPHSVFMSAMGAVFFVKFTVVAAGLLYTWVRPGLPQVEFALGMVGGWMVGFVALAVAMQRGPKVQERTGA